MFSILFKKTRISLLVTATFVLSVVAAIFGQGARQPNERMWRAVDERSLDQAGQACDCSDDLSDGALGQRGPGASAGRCSDGIHQGSQPRIPSFICPCPTGRWLVFASRNLRSWNRDWPQNIPDSRPIAPRALTIPPRLRASIGCRPDFTPSSSLRSGTVLIDPYAEGNTTDYMTYWKKDAANTAQGFECDFVDPELPPLPAGDVPVPAVTSGTTLRTYRLALACNQRVLRRRRR